MNTHDNGLEPTPQDWGFPANPTRANQECWDRQESFLEAYKRTSLLTHAARAAEVSVYAVDKWISRDVYAFKKRMETAHREYCDWIREEIQSRLAEPKGNRGSDILLMFEAKAAMPEMYREEVKVIGVDTAKQMMDRLREMATKEREQQAALEAPAIEGQFQEVPPPGAAAVVKPPPPAHPEPERSPPALPQSVSAKEKRMMQLKMEREARSARRPTPAREVRRR
jgi:hypothetical protein